MGTPTSLTSSAAPVPGGGDPLAEIDAILSSLAQARRLSAERSAHELDEQGDFRADFQAVCEQEVRPAMDSVIERLRRSGGGGIIEEHPGGEPRISTPRLTLWMSLEGEIVGAGRPDRNPYLQLDADVVARRINVSEGDLWQGGGGGSSGRIAVWQLTDLTHSRIAQELVAILRRAARVPLPERALSVVEEQSTAIP